MQVCEKDEVSLHFRHIVAISSFLTRAKPNGTELVCQSKSLLDPCLPLTSWSGKNGEIAW